MPRNPSACNSARCAVALVLLSIVVAAPAPALAAAQRTFVASYGNDANACSLLAPCRSFNAAILQTNPGGEVVILDTAGYGPMTIDKSIKVIGPSGVYGGISVLGAGGGVTTGVLINAGDTDVVTLRGLDISGVPTIAPLPLLGINVQNVGVLHVEKSSIGNFTQDTSACILVNSAKPIQVYVNDSFLRECRFGINAIGGGPDDSARIGLVVDNTRIEHGLNTATTGTAAVKVNDAVVASVRNSVIAFAGDGIRAFNTNSAVNLRVFVMGTQLTRMINAAIETGGTAGSVQVNVSTSVLNNNNAGLLHGRGLAILSNDVISTNTHSLVDCGAGASSVTSLGYSGGNGSNSMSNNPDAGVPGGCTAYLVPVQFIGK